MTASKKIKKQAKKEAKTTTANNPLKYEHMTVEFAFTDGEIDTAIFYSLPDCLRYIIILP